MAEEIDTVDFVAVRRWRMVCDLWKSQPELEPYPMGHEHELLHGEELVSGTDNGMEGHWVEQASRKFLCLLLLF